MPDKKLPAVPETILKRRKRQAESRALRVKEALKSKADKKVFNDLVFFINALPLPPFNSIRLF